MTDRLMGLTEMAKTLGISRRRAGQLVREYEDFPEPEVVSASGPLWARGSVEGWMQSHPELRPRPPLWIPHG